MSQARPPAIDWYFDFISPYAWLQAEALHRLPVPLNLRCRPVLFAGLLEHWGQLGPAEIEPKRVVTDRYVVWRAAQLGLPVKLPSRHPFNPLRLLRLSIVAGPTLPNVLRIFRYVWSEGHLPDDEGAWNALALALDVPDAERRIAEAGVKDELRRNGEAAIAQGVFGVPTAVVDGKLFWGADATDMLLGYLAGAPIFGSDEMRRAGELPLGTVRPR